MSKAKPLMFGAALGASAMFFAQQYHVVHSHDGLQVIPRTPQQSIGLAYADIRTWSPSQWTDRPELARALMAHGSADLISESVAATLADRVSEDTSTLDELRGYLNGVKKTGGSDDNLLTFPPMDEAEKTRGDELESSIEEDLVPIPFMQETRTKPPADPFRAATRSDDAAAPVRSDSGSRFSSDDLLDGFEEVESPTPSRNEVPPENKAAKPKKPKSSAEQAEEAINLIFGGSTQRSSTPKPATTPKTTPKPALSETESMFEEVKTQLENRAQEALNRAKETTKEKALSSVESSTRDSSSYVREKATELIPDAAKNLLKNSTAPGSTPATPGTSAGGSSLIDFDPFLE